METGEPENRETGKPKNRRTGAPRNKKIAKYFVKPKGFLYICNRKVS